MIKHQTPIGAIDAPAGMSERIKNMSDQELSDELGTTNCFCPFVFREIQNRGIWHKTERAKLDNERQGQARAEFWNDFIGMCEAYEGR